MVKPASKTHVPIDINLQKSKSLTVILTLQSELTFQHYKYETHTENCKPSFAGVLSAFPTVWNPQYQGLKGIVLLRGHVGFIARSTARLNCLPCSVFWHLGFSFIFFPLPPFSLSALARFLSSSLSTYIHNVVNFTAKFYSMFYWYSRSAAIICVLKLGKCVPGSLSKAIQLSSDH